MVLGAPVAEVMIELFQRRFVVTPVALEGDGEVFVGMGVMEREGAGFIQRGRIVDRTCPGQQQQRGHAKGHAKASAKAASGRRFGFRQRQ